MRRRRRRRAYSTQRDCGGGSQRSLFSGGSGYLDFWARQTCPPTENQQLQVMLGETATGRFAAQSAIPIRLRTVTGFQNRVNDVVYCPPLVKHEEEATTVVYFGGDVQVCYITKKRIQVNIFLFHASLNTHHPHTPSNDESKNNHFCRLSASNILMN